MDSNNKKLIAYIGIGASFIYFLSVVGFLILKTDILLTCWEVATMLSALIVLLVLLCILNDSDNYKVIWKQMAIVFMSCTTALTCIAHFVNITVTRKLIAEGYNMPDYYQIGKWPSVEMAVDYLAWGFFMGLAFLCTSFAINKENGRMKKLKYTLLLSGLLCLIGIVGVVLINENCWYVAPLGYGIGFMVICIEMILLHKEQEENEHSEK